MRTPQAKVEYDNWKKSTLERTKNKQQKHKGKELARLSSLLNKMEDIYAKMEKSKKEGAPKKEIHTLLGLAHRALGSSCDYLQSYLIQELAELDRNRNN